VPLYRPNDKISPFRGGDGLLIVSEAAWTRRDTPDHADEHPSHPQFRIGRFSGLPPYDDKVALGGWQYTAKFDALAEVDQDGNPLQKRDSSGAYLLVDKSASPDNRSIASVPIMAPALRQPGSFLDVRKTK
jgi:hypothetical protein